MAEQSDRPDVSQLHLLTVAEVAATLRISKMTVYRMLHDGVIPAVRVGRSFRVSREAVENFLRDSYQVGS